MNRWTAMSAALAALVVPLLGQHVACAAEPAGTVLSSETNQPAVVEFLRRIINGRTKADAREEYLAQGTSLIGDGRLEVGNGVAHARYDVRTTVAEFFTRAARGETPV